MNIWFVSIFENTPIDDNQNTRFNNLAKEALKRGHKVTFWSSTFNHSQKKQRELIKTVINIEENLTLRFINSISYSKNTEIKRFYSHSRFGTQITTTFDQIDEKPDVIFVAYPPLSSTYKISKWAIKNDVKCIIDIIDPWPDAFIPHMKNLPGFICDIILFPYRRMLNKTLNNLSAVTGISNQYLDWARSYDPSLETKCFYPAVQYDLMQVQLEEASKRVNKLNEEFNIIYAGSFGYSYDIPTILKAAEILESRFGKKITFTIAGDGPQRSLIEDYEKAHSNLKYVGRVPKEKLMEFYYLADLGLTQHISSAAQSVTYKLFDLLASGLPILNSLESEMRDIIVDNKVGLHNSPGDVKTLVENITKCFTDTVFFNELKMNTKSVAKMHGDTKKVYSEAINFVEEVVGKRILVD